MKRYFFIFFVTVHLFAQQLPLHESNSLLYSKERYGINLMNGYKIFQKKDGSIICGNYFNNVYHLTSTKQISLNHYFKDNELLIAYFEVGSTEIFCTRSAIIIVNNNKVVKRVRLNKQDEILENMAIF